MRRVSSLWTGLWCAILVELGGFVEIDVVDLDDVAVAAAGFGIGCMVESEGLVVDLD